MSNTNITAVSRTNIYEDGSHFGAVKIHSQNVNLNGPV
jgi:hypothetical protein